MATAAPPASGNIDIGRALTFIKDDPEWLTKLLIGSLMVIASMFLIGVPFLLGYYQRTLKRAAEGHTYPLPDWDDWGGFFVDGLKLFLVSLAYAMIIILPMIGCMCGLGMLIGGASQGREDAAGPLAAVGALGMIALYAAMFVAGLALWIYLPAAQTRLALSGSVGDAFQVGANLAYIRRNLANYALSLLIMLIANFLAQFGLLLLCVGILPATVWAYTCFSYALGETARRDAAMVPASPTY